MLSHPMVHLGNDTRIIQISRKISLLIIFLCLLLHLLARKKYIIKINELYLHINGNIYFLTDYMIKTSIVTFFLVSESSSETSQSRIPLFYIIRSAGKKDASERPAF